ncbi:hypothetical protein AN639_08310 [Candidatus Epulonipiscium fishelsonii]|uniref:Uncharacterized protein n=1 Tax=Candidatus Epulonipiscium fishelsonii TaxID=77094 RepID=A0ACC8XH53_9FIRM|nr:hypothetical protein AN639_08310 [Epulopiscium sp. SCG-B05WGA-EpuloA1]ONI43017.1 hypothetical protein AN396_00205 [Epulopiscium sp. SCG-B11WGA-EpuloA1]
MNIELIYEIIKDMQQNGTVLPSYILNKPLHWTSRVYLANLLNQETECNKVYNILKDIYEENTFRYHKDIHGAYETYIEEKVQFLLTLASLNIKVTGKAKGSIKYLDEALMMLDAAESVKPYINLTEVKELRTTYLDMQKVSNV